MIRPEFWSGKQVFLTGHTGFKGAWASLLLRRLGADVHGYALAPGGERDLFLAAGVERDLHHTIGDICDPVALERALAASQAEIVIHMAAQPLVRRSYEAPAETYATNVMGTINMLDAVRRHKHVRAVVVVTSDKCYENIGQARGYRESDPLGGHDPYSSSKACAEIATASYRRSFFHSDGGAAIASARAGNVIGGGDWANDRLVPDAMRAFMAGAVLRVRNPRSVRPWQHVLDPLLGYLLLAERLMGDVQGWDESWNFGPLAASEVPVETVVNGLTRAWGGGASWEEEHTEQPHEAAYLKLDCSKARGRLGWRPLIGFDHAIQLTVDWYRALDRGQDMRAVTAGQIADMLDAACPGSDGCGTG